GRGTNRSTRSRAPASSRRPATPATAPRGARTPGTRRPPPGPVRRGRSAGCPWVEFTPGDGHSLPGPGIEAVRQRREILRPLRTQRHEVLQPHAPTSPLPLRLVEPGLQGEDVPLLQQPFGARPLPEAGGFVELVPHAVPKAVHIAARG